MKQINENQEYIKYLQINILKTDKYPKINFCNQNYQLQFLLGLYIPKTFPSYETRKGGGILKASRSYEDNNFSARTYPIIVLYGV